MAIAPYTRPKLRPIETIFIPDRVHGRALMLRDTEGIAPSAVTIPGSLAAIVLRLNGSRSIAQIASDVSRVMGHRIDERLVAQLVEELDAAKMLDTPAFVAHKKALIKNFEEAQIRPAFHAGGAYHGDADKLTRYIEDECLAKAPSRKANGAMVGLCAPHMDLWRAAVGYGHAYRALGESLSQHIDTFVLLGTSHAPMRRPFTICEKIFATPLGVLAPDRNAIRELASASRFDVREDEYLHKSEHSLEFQAVFLRHALSGRAEEDMPKIVPILCGLGASQASGCDPSLDADTESFLSALREVVERRRGRVMLIAGADLAHIGPRFGDQRPLDEHGRRVLAERDGESIALALARDAPGFFAHVRADLGSRRVCGLGPIYTMLRVLPESLGDLLHYDQCVDPEEGSVVSHSSFSFFA